MYKLLGSHELNLLKKYGLEINGNSRNIPVDFRFEPPCSIKNMNVDQKVSIGAFSYGVSGYLCGVNIGRYCSFGENVQIGRQNHPLNWLSTSPFLYLNNTHIMESVKFFHDECVESIPARDTPPTSLQNTIIGNDVWIGHGAIIKAGITIGDGAIVAAGSVVVKNVEPYTIVGGNPAKKIKMRFSEEDIDRLMNVEWWRFSPKELINYDVSDISKFLDSFSSSQLKEYNPEIYTVKDIFK